MLRTANLNILYVLCKGVYLLLTRLPLRLRSEGFEPIYFSLIGCFTCFTSVSIL